MLQGEWTTTHTFYAEVVERCDCPTYVGNAESCKHPFSVRRPTQINDLEPLSYTASDINMRVSTIDGLIPISMATLSSKAVIGCNVYLRAQPQAKPVLFFSADEVPQLTRLTPLAGQGVNKLFIDRGERERYQAYLRENWQALIEDDSQTLVNRVAVMSEVMRDVLSERFCTGDTASIVLAAQQLSEGTCHLMDSGSIVATQLCNVLHHDYATFTHCANVSLYCVLLAQQLGCHGRDLQEIAVGGLLHDIGKLRVDERILAKPDRLDEVEMQIMREHPGAGFRELALRQDLSFGQLMMAYQHHERLDGSGYPVGCPGQQIHPWAKICAVVDVYEALTSQRPYRRPDASQNGLGGPRKRSLHRV